MSDMPRRPGVIVGIFVTVGVTILAGGVLAIGDLNETFTRKITVSAVFDEVNGLQVGDNIWFSGVKVGRVQDMRFQPDSRVEVEMTIDRSAAAFIREDARAKIGSDGPIGNKLVVLYDGSPEAPPVEDGDVLQIGAGVSLDAMMATFQQNNTNMVAITEDLKTLTAGLVAGEGAAGRLLSDEELAVQVGQTVASLQAASAEAQAATENLSAFTAKLNQPGTLPYDLVNDETLYPSLTATAARLEEAATDASAVVDDIARGTADSSTVAGALLSDEQAGADLKETLSNLKEGTRLLNEDLEAAQDSFLLRGAFRRKARAEAAEDAEAEREGD